MSDDACECAKCQGDGYFDQSFHELRERLKTAIPTPVLLAGPNSSETVDGYWVPQAPPTYFLMTESDHQAGQAVIDRQRACIEELVGLIGYLPEAYAVLERHGLK
jgi:hypothetical protein